MQQRARNRAFVRAVNSESVAYVSAAKAVANFKYACHVRIVKREYAGFVRLFYFEGLRLGHIGPVFSPFLPVD